jgi:hypothetical protein
VCQRCKLCDARNDAVRAPQSHPTAEPAQGSKTPERQLIVGTTKTPLNNLFTYNVSLTVAFRFREMRNLLKHYLSDPSTALSA